MSASRGLARSARRFGALLLVGNAACGLVAGLSDHVLEDGDAGTGPGRSEGDDASLDGAANADGPAVFGGPVVLARGQADPRGVSIDGTRVYWANQAGGSILAIAKDGSAATPTVITAEAKHPRVTKVGPAQIFWGSDEADTGQACTGGAGGGIMLPVGIMSLDKAPDAAPRQLFCGDLAYQVHALAIDGTDLYWANPTNGGFVVRTSQGSGTTAELSGQKAESVAVNTSSVFWGRVDGIAIAPKAAFPPADAGLLVPASAAALGLAADDDAVYFTNASSVMKAALAGTPSAATVLASNQDGPSALAIFEGDVYWTNAGDGRVLMIPKSGAPSTLRVLASGQGGPTSIAVDATGVYWTNATGEVMRLPR